MDTVNHEANMEKYNNYRELFPRLNRAVKSGFYFEAIFIAYAIVEDRTESALRHLGKWDAYRELCEAKETHPTISGKISRLRREAKKAASPANPYFSDELLPQFVEWKDRRNKKIHELMNHAFSEDELQELAEAGQKLARTISNRTESMKRAIARARKQQESE